MFAMCFLSSEWNIMHNLFVHAETESKRETRREQRTALRLKTSESEKSLFLR